MEAYIGGAFMMDHSYIELLYGRVNLGMSRRDYDYFWESPWSLQLSQKPLFGPPCLWPPPNVPL
jgi:hypothetical protein